MVRALLLACVGVVAISLAAALSAPKTPLRLAAPPPSSDVTLGGAPLRQIVPLEEAVLRSAERPLSALSVSEVRAYRSDGRRAVMVFDDGSELFITPSVAEELPYDLRLRLSYAR